MTNKARRPFTLATGFAILLMTSNGATAFNVPPPGATFTGQLTISTDDGTRSIPLPGGNWSVLASSKGKIDAKPTNTAAISRPVNEVATIVLTQLQDKSTKAILAVTTNLTSANKYYTDSACKSAQFFFQNKYQSGSWDQRCLEVNVTADLLNTANTEPWSGARSSLLRSGMSYPYTFIESTYTEYNTQGKYLSISYLLNPTVYGYPDTQINPIQSPWNKDLIVTDPVRSNFMSDFMGFAQQYAEVLHSNLVGGLVGPVPTFSPRQNSMPAQVAPTTSAAQSDYEGTCTGLGFKQNTKALTDCIAELKARSRK